MKRMTINEAAGLYNSIEQTTIDLRNMLYSIKGAERTLMEMGKHATELNATHLNERIDAILNKINQIVDCVDAIQDEWRDAGARTAELVRIEAPNTNVI